MGVEGQGVPEMKRVVTSNPSSNMKRHFRASLYFIGTDFDMSLKNNEILMWLELYRTSGVLS